MVIGPRYLLLKPFCCHQYSRTTFHRFFLPPDLGSVLVPCLSWRWPLPTSSALCCATFISCPGLKVNAHRYKSSPCSTLLMIPREKATGLLGLGPYQRGPPGAETLHIPQSTILATIKMASPFLPAPSNASHKPMPLVASHTAVRVLRHLHCSPGSL
jgi:hypothetical protein